LSVVRTSNSRKLGKSSDRFSCIFNSQDSFQLAPSKNRRSFSAILITVVHSNETMLVNWTF
jgi:hypothetical protein